MFSSLVQYALLLFLAWFLYKFYRFFKFCLKLRTLGKAADKFPMEPKHWIWGHMNKLSGPGEGGFDYFLRMVNKYPKAFGMYIGNFIRPYVVVYDPDIIKMLMKVPSKKPHLLGMYGYAKYWMGDGLSISSGPKWFRNRRLITPAFHFDVLRQYCKIFNQSMDIFEEKLSQLAANKTQFEAQEMLSYLTLDSILKCAFSFESDVLVDNKNRFYPHAVDEITKHLMKRYFEPWKHFDVTYWWTEDGKNFKKNADLVNTISEKLIRERRNLIESDPENVQKHNDFLNILILAKDEDGHGLTDQELRDEINTFIFGGFDTTSTTLSWILYLLATHPQYQKRCQKEVDDLFEGRTDKNLNWEDCQKLNYITMCIKETLRICAGVPIAEKELEEDEVIDGHVVPAGMSVMINLYCLHHHPKLWKKPMTFDPERFSDENIISMDPFAFLPFSAGPRNCIGQAFAMEEMKIVLARLLGRFTFTPKENHVPMKTMAILTRSSNGIYLNVVERLFGE